MSEVQVKERTAPEGEDFELLRDQFRQLKGEVDNLRIQTTWTNERHIQETLQRHEREIGVLNGNHIGLTGQIAILETNINRTSDSLAKVAEAMSKFQVELNDMDRRGQAIVKTLEAINEQLHEQNQRIKELDEFMRKEKEAEDRQRAIMTRAQRWGARLGWVLLMLSAGTGVGTVIAQILNLFTK